jgi:SAM-dependent methyltransferase
MPRSPIGWLLVAIIGMQAVLVTETAAFVSTALGTDFCARKPGMRSRPGAQSILASARTADGEGGLDSDPYAGRRRQISYMVHQLSRIGADLEALGPDGDRVAVVGELKERLDSLQGQLAAAKESSMQSQLSSFDLDAQAKAGEVKLHLGCGRNTLAGWLNADLHGWRLNDGDGWQVNRAKERVLSINVGTTPLPLPDGSCALVYTSHMLEHLIHPAQTSLVMEEVHRVLAPGGTVRIVVPDAAVWLRGYAQQDEEFFGLVRKEWQHWDWAGDRYKIGRQRTSTLVIPTIREC